MIGAKRIPLPPFTLSLSKPALSLSKGAGGGGLLQQAGDGHTGDVKN